MKKDQELIVITKTYDLILWSCNHTSRFPRSHRFVLGERIERNLTNNGFRPASTCRRDQRPALPESEGLYPPSDRAGAKSRSSSRVGDTGCPAE